MARIDARLARHGSLGAALIKGVVGTTGLRLAFAGFGFITSILLARNLGAHGYGTYSFVMALVAFFTIPSELGIPGLAVREIAVANARKDWGHMRGFTIRAHQGIALLSLTLMTAGALTLLAFGEHVEPVKRQCMWLALPLIPLISLGALRGSMLRGLRLVVLGQVPERVLRPAGLLISILAILFVSREYLTPPAVMLGQLAAATVAFSWGLTVFMRRRPREAASAEPVFRTRDWIRSSIPFGLSATLLLINGRTDVLALGLFRADAEVGVYRVAVQIAATIIFSLAAVNAIQGPHIAHLYATGDMKRLQKMITRSSQAILLAAAPSVLVIVLLGPQLIRWIYGPQFEGAYVPLVILAVGQLVNASTGSVNSLLNMTGHERETTRVLLMAAILNVTLSLTLTPLWGMRGAALATASTLIFWNLTMWRIVYKRLGIKASPFLRENQ
jgi:O-antigen/teichoic acid export membrane protein